MTKEQFESWYAANSGMTVEELHSLGEHAHPCDCEDEQCRGWQMVSDDRIALLERLGL